MKTSRQRLLEYIQSQRAVTSAELSRALKMTPANARHHLAILQEQGLVTVTGLRPAAGKGRPAQVYGISPAVLRNNLGGLSAALLDELLQGLDPAACEGVLQRLAARMAGDHAPPAGNLSRRLVETVRRLNEMGYQARWEAHARAPRLFFNHCPYLVVLEAHLELCSLDACLLEILTGVAACQVVRQATDAHGALYCQFVLGPGRATSKEQDRP